MDQPSNILAPPDVRAWREAAARAGARVAVVAGSFDIFQPGNLQAVRVAARQADRVCVVVDADERRQRRDWAWNSAQTRTESVGHLRAAAAVLPLTAGQAAAGLRGLRPYRLVDCLAQEAALPLHAIARALADGIANLPPLAGCFTQDISDRLLRNETPVPVAPFACVSLPGSADLARFHEQRRGRILVTVNGCFDILHLGHLRMLARAREMGDALAVMINNDDSVRAYKGPTRPVFPASFRLTALDALASVSFVYPFAGDNPLALLAEIRPDIHVKGGTYDEERVRAERELLAGWGGRVEFYPLVEGYSTSDLIKRTQGVREKAEHSTSNIQRSTKSLNSS